MTAMPATPAPAAELVDDWVARLEAQGPDHDQAVRELHELMLRAARRQVSRMPAAARLGRFQRDEVAQTAADEATMAVLGRLRTFEGRSRFTTWAFKFGILHAAAEVRRASWRHREVDLALVAEPVSRQAGPEHVAEGTAFTSAVARAMHLCLTDHQRRVATALLVDEVPVDVLAERLGSNRNAVYKTLHDARVRLRAQLTLEGFLSSPTSEGGTR